MIKSIKAILAQDKDMLKYGKTLKHGLLMQKKERYFLNWKTAVICFY